MKNTKITVSIPTHTVEKVRDFISWSDDISFAGLVAALLDNFVKEIETKELIPAREKELKTGRKQNLQQ